MKSKKILSFLLSFAMMLGMITVPTFAKDATQNIIDVYLTISKYGEIVNDKDSNAMAGAKVELTGKAEYTLDDVFIAAHNLYYDGGAIAGYQSGESDWGLSVKKLWGDESGNFGYQINGGAVDVTGLSNTINNEDCIDAYIMTPNYEAYSCFDKYFENVYAKQKLELRLKYVSGYDEDNNYAPIVSDCSDATITINGTKTEIKTDLDGKAELSFETPGKYIVSASKTQIKNASEVTAITAPVCVVDVKYPDARITIPHDAKLFVGNKANKHFVSFAQQTPIVSIENDDDTITYYYDLKNNSKYNFRVSRDNYVTYGGIFTKPADFDLNITEEQLSPEGKTKTTVDKDTSSNNGYNVADIWLNINPQGYLKLSKNETYQIVNIRNWETIDTVTNNYFIEPDYHYEVIDENGNKSDVVEINENGLITAKKSGTAIVLVTYDAINIDGALGGPFFGAIWPENTGVFVVSVDSGDSGITTGMTINEDINKGLQGKNSANALDCEHDVIYFTGEQGEYTFVPATQGVTVSVANPKVSKKMTFSGFTAIDANDDGSISVTLTEGRNIVKLEKDGKAEYQIITAKAVSIVINNGEDVKPGDAISIKFDTTYNPINKLAGVYNYIPRLVYTDVDGYDGKIIGTGGSSQYAHASTPAAQTISATMKIVEQWGAKSLGKDGAFIVPQDYDKDIMTLSGGAISFGGFGSWAGEHRNINLQDGKLPNLNAGSPFAYLGKLPDIQIPIVATKAELNSITLNTENVKTTYYEGDKFDMTNLVVTANYEDDTTQTATNYTITPKVMSADTEKVTITYRNKTAEIPVTVNELKVEEIKITKSPDKITYEEGETFNPTGMVVTATYNNGAKLSTKDYSYSPNRELETDDTEMMIAYTGDNAVEEIASVSQPITVTKKASSGGSSSNKINVYFTLLGDSKHGTPTDEYDTHTKAANNLKTWIGQTSVSVEKGSYVIDVVEKALSLNGIPFVNVGNYISEIKGLAEFDNGEFSGWMYIINGTHSDKGVAEQTVKNGDKIIFHYTDDYTKEEYSKNWNTSSSGRGNVLTYMVKFETNGASAIKSQTINKNATISEKEFPQKDGYTFEGWYTDKGLTNKYDFTQKVTSDITLYAKWIKNSESNPTVDTDNNSDINKKTKITFKDVEVGSWYEEAVGYAVENNLFNGISETEFAPNDILTRAMLVTVIYRLENPETKKAFHGFTDVDDGEWYFDAVAWAAKSGIVSGVSETEFAPDDGITREQMATIIYRYAKMKGYDMQNISNLSDFTDATQISDWAVDAVKWANGAEIITGVSKTSISPKLTATRAQVAAILMRFCKMSAK